MPEDRAEQYSRDLQANTSKVDRNAVLLAVVLLIQTWGIALIERNYRETQEPQCVKIGLLK